MINSHDQHPIKNSVVVITYNQENLIERALESILCQRACIFEVIICDDCSTDTTWDVVLGYKEKYPSLIKPFRNSVNLGIIGNIQSTWSKVEGNLMWLLAGDDAFCEGVFERANKIILENKLNADSDKFAVIFDWEFRSPDGMSKIYRNHLVTKHNALSLKLRNLIYNRSLGVSRKVYKSFFQVRNDLGIYSDGLIDIQVQMFAENFYYSQFVGSIYFGDVGISSKSLREEGWRSYMLVIDEYLKMLPNLSRKDIDWLKYLRASFQYLLDPNIKNAKRFTRHFFNNLTSEFGFKYTYTQLIQFSRTLSVIRKRYF